MTLVTSQHRWDPGRACREHAPGHFHHITPPPKVDYEHHIWVRINIFVPHPPSHAWVMHIIPSPVLVTVIHPPQTSEQLTLRVAHNSISPSGIDTLIMTGSCSSTPKERQAELPAL